MQELATYQIPPPDKQYINRMLGWSGVYQETEGQQWLLQRTQTYNSFIDFGETGSYFMEKIFCVHPPAALSQLFVIYGPIFCQSNS